MWQYISGLDSSVHLLEDTVGMYALLISANSEANLSGFGLGWVYVNWLISVLSEKKREKQTNWEVMH